ncbi:MAG: addiction module protein [Rhodothermales bacterium]
MSVDQLEAEILKLPREIRARLAERLLSSLEDGSEIEEAWVAEAERRYQRYLEGEENVVSVDTVLAKLRDELEL